MEQTLNTKSGLITKKEPLYFHSEYDKKTGDRVTIAGVYDGKHLTIGRSKYSAIYKLPFCRKEGRERALANITNTGKSFSFEVQELTLMDFINIAKSLSGYILKHKCVKNIDLVFIAIDSVDQSKIVATEPF